MPGSLFGWTVLVTVGTLPTADVAEGIACSQAIYCASLLHLMSVHMINDGPSTPIPVDAVRDAYDWLAFRVGLGSAVIGLTVGVVAIVLAVKANRTAKQALAEAAIAERRAVERATFERKRLFELDALGMLMRDLDIAAEQKRIVLLASEPVTTPYYMDLYFGSRLALIPQQDLPFWRQYPSLDIEERYALFPEIPNEEIDVARKQIIERRERWVQPRGYAEALINRLRRDILDAIEQRMTS